MKTILLYSTFLFFSSFLDAQERGSITSKQPNPKAGTPIHYEYRPAEGLVVPQKATASIIYFNKGYSKKNIPLNNNGGVYEFEFKAPDSADVLIVAIVDDNKNVIDNNKEAGFTSYLYDNKGKRFPSAKVTEATLKSGFAGYYHKLNVSPAILIKMYEEGYKLKPELKKQSFYIDYLSLLYKEKKDEAKPQLLNYAKQMLDTKANESNWTNAQRVYRILKMDDEQKKTEEKILSAFPNGQVARDKFWSSLYSSKDMTEEKVLEAMNDYQKRFNDTSSTSKDNFYVYMVRLLSKNKDWDGVLKYGGLVERTMSLAGNYNNLAWQLAGSGLSGSGNDLEFAKAISKRSLDYVEKEMKDVSDNLDADELVDVHMMYADTYALILYKLNNFDSAFYYQHEILQRGRPVGVDGRERYAVFAEKAKGASFTKDYIEQQLLSGVSSPAMLLQLQSLYKQLNLPQEEFLKIKETNSLVARKKTIEKIIAKYGSEKGIDFNLKDLDGKPVSLSSLVGKVVVLDFWATWCGPCIGSFPAMQELVNKYKDDKEVVFLFIDTWEQKEPKLMLENATKFMKEKNYNFQVLLDEKDKVVADYKVDGIPAKFVIDKKGKIAFADEAGNDLAAVIEAARQY